MADIFGVNKDNSSSGVLSFQNVALIIEGSVPQLVQTANLNYSRQITPVMAVGLDTVYLSPQPGQGTLNITRAIGETGVFGRDFALDKTGCELKYFALTSIPDTCQHGTGLVAGLGMMAGYSLNVNVGGGVSVTEGCSLHVVDVQPS